MLSILNTNLSINKISENITVVDNILDEHFVGFLRLRMQLANKYDTTYPNYDSIDFFKGSDYILDSLSQELINKFNLDEYKRTWSFIYKNNTQGINVHADMSHTTVNFWVTPDKCMKDHTKNGFLVCDKKQPLDWMKKHPKYKVGFSYNYVDKFFKDEQSSIVKIKYKCNRAVIFHGALFHKTDDIKTHEGILNKRVSYTMLFGNNIHE
jgi:hypothetical protein